MDQESQILETKLKENLNLEESFWVMFYFLKNVPLLKGEVINNPYLGVNKAKVKTPNC